jgi:hypothetical protein
MFGNTQVGRCTGAAVTGAAAHQEVNMTGAILAWVLVALVIVVIIVAVPVWRGRQRRRLAPDYRDARLHQHARGNPGTAGSTSDYVPTEPVRAADGLTVARRPLADPDEDQAGR